MYIKGITNYKYLIKMNSIKRIDLNEKNPFTNIYLQLYNIQYNIPMSSQNKKNKQIFIILKILKLNIPQAK